MLNPTPILLICLAVTFPAGTLSGAPKFKAMQLIDEFENNHEDIMEVASVLSVLMEVSIMRS